MKKGPPKRAFCWWNYLLSQAEDFEEATGGRFAAVVLQETDLGDVEAAFVLGADDFEELAFFDPEAELGGGAVGDLAPDAGMQDEEDQAAVLVADDGLYSAGVGLGGHWGSPWYIYAYGAALKCW